MKQLLLCCTAIAALPFTQSAEVDAPAERAAVQPKIQIAILLDTSSSMDGLINQARTHLWSIVNEFARAKKEGQQPDFEVALFEYGNSGLPSKENFIREVVPLTTDLDKVSESLFALKTNGGDEYCGAVIREATKALKWSDSAKDFKAIYIAGNEPFTQGPVAYKKACQEAIAKGIIINTIHCGPEKSGVNGEWDKGAKLADGTFLTIDQNVVAEQIAAPQDKLISSLNEELNKTYVAYGESGGASKQRQAAMDQAATSAAPSAGVNRIISKSKAVYKNSQWDLVDAQKEGALDLSKIKDADLPEELKGKSEAEKKEYIEALSQKRAEIQKQINQLASEREKFLIEERKKLASDSSNTLETVVTESAKKQVSDKGFIIE